MSNLKTLWKGKPNQPKEEENARSPAFKCEGIFHSHEEVKTWKEKRRGFGVTFQESPIEGGQVEEIGEGVEEAGQGEGKGEGEDPGKVGEEESKEEANVDAMVEAAEVPPALNSTRFQHETATWDGREIWAEERRQLQESKLGKRQGSLKREDKR